MRCLFHVTAPVYLFALLLTAGCASTAPAVPVKEVRIYNLGGTGAKGLPTEIRGCRYLGRVWGSAEGLPVVAGSPHYDATVALQTIRSKAAKKGADSAYVNMPDPGLPFDKPTVKATIFHCQGAPLASQIGKEVDPDQKPY